MNEYVCTEKTEKYVNRIEAVIRESKASILDFFNAKDEGQFNYRIYVYETIEDLRKGLEERGFKNNPEHLCACFKDEDQSLNFFEPKENNAPNEWDKNEYDLVIYHELIHAIEYTLYGTQPEWLSEGIAKYLDGTYKRGVKWLLQNYIKKIPIPQMHELEKEFGFHDYDSYDYAYIMVSYLLETMGKERFLKFLENANEISEISKNLVEKSIKYYENFFA